MPTDMRGVLVAVLCPDTAAYLRWLSEQKEYALQRCKEIKNMLDVYQAQKGGIEVIQLAGWMERWNPGQISEIKRRLEL